MKDAKMKIDLHGVRHEEVPVILAEHLFWQRKENPEIITGNSETMRKIVINWLDRFKYNYIIEAHNPGCIKVYT
tara:strand:+ start:2836 stop:3057 length:222 start_codon:yes stop_codon:yes gene_type:complete